jgi:Integrase core domain
VARPDRRETLFVEPGSPWENGYCESFDSEFRDELLASEQFSTLHVAKVLIEVAAPLQYDQAAFLSVIAHRQGDFAM